MTEIDQALREYAGRWTERQDAPPDLDEALALVRTRRPRRTWLVIAAAASVVAVLAAVLVAGLDRHDPAPPPGRPAATHLPAGLADRARAEFDRSMLGRYRIEIVRTTEAKAFGLIGVPSTERHPIWVAAAYGNVQFVDTIDRGIDPRPQHGAMLVVGFTVSGPAVTPVLGRAMPRAVDLAGLGPVTRLGPFHGAASDYTQLRRLALSTARANGDPAPLAVAVRTTLLKAEAATHAGHSNVPDQPVWLIQLIGDFTCVTCHGPPGSTPPTGRYITLIEPVHAGQRGIAEFGISDTDAHLGRLGPLVELR